MAPGVAVIASTPGIAAPGPKTPDGAEAYGWRPANAIASPHWPPASPVPEPGRLPCLANWARWLEEDVAGLRAALGVFWDGAVYWIPARRTPDDRRACFDISRTLDLGPAPSCGALSFVLTDPRFGSGPFRVSGTTRTTPSNVRMDLATSTLTTISCPSLSRRISATRIGDGVSIKDEMIMDASPFPGHVMDQKHLHRMSASPAR